MSGVCLSEKDLLEGLAAAGVSLPVSEDGDGGEGILSESFSAGGLEIPNRLVCQPMEGCDGNFDGTPGELTLRRYLRLAGGGAGLIWFEATAVLPEGRANPRQLMINKDNAGEFARAVELIKETAVKKNGYAPAVVMQATHSGRYSRPNGFPEPLIAINSPLLEGDRPVSADRIVTDGYLDSVRDALVEGARLAERAGFDGVDIKCCHRYLASELLSAWGRPGRYGGSFENRTRLVRESAAGAAEVCGSGFTVASRFNVYDGYPYPLGFGVSPDGGTEQDYSEGKALASMLFEAGVRLFDVTLGNPYFNPHVNRPFSRGGYEAPEPPLRGVARILEGAKEIRSALPEGTGVVCSGLSFLCTEAPRVAAACVAEGWFDLAGFGREVLAYPDFAADILAGRGFDRRKICVACSKCTEIMRTPGGTPGCALRDPLYTDLYRRIFGGKKTDGE